MDIYSLYSLEINLTFIIEVLNLFRIKSRKVYNLSILNICVEITNQFNKIRNYNDYYKLKSYIAFSKEEQSRFILNLYILSKIFPLAESKMGFLYLRYLNYFLITLQDHFQ